MIRWAVCSGMDHNIIIYFFEYRASIWLRYQNFDNRLEDEPRVGTPIHWSLEQYNLYDITKKKSQSQNDGRKYKNCNFKRFFLCWSTRCQQPKKTLKRFMKIETLHFDLSQAHFCQQMLFYLERCFWNSSCFFVTGIPQSLHGGC